MKMIRSLLLFVCLAGCDAGPGKDQGTVGSGAAPSTPAVVVAKVVSQKLSKGIRLPGELWAYRSVGIHAKIQGFVEKIDVDRGSEVKQGQAIAQLSAPEYEAQAHEVQAKLASDVATYKRLKEASGTPGVVAGNELAISEKVVEADRARLRATEQNLAYLKIAAPFDGVITERNVHEGSIVGPSSAQPIVRIQEIARLRLVVHLPESAVGGITSGDKVKFTVPAYPLDVFTGAVAREASSLDPKMRTMPVELDVENAAKKLKPGMYAEVHWEFRRPTESLFVPASAVVTTTERRFVIRVADGETQWVDVRVGQTLGSQVEVFGNLSPGDQVALRGTDELREKTKVTAKDPPPPN
jgi:membrane fusion protein, multidrug efflux system